MTKTEDVFQIVGSINNVQLRLTRQKEAGGWLERRKKSKNSRKLGKHESYSIE